MLTKPLGTGILTTAAKAELLSGAEYRAMTDLMAALNRDAARAAVPLRPSACTDVTGFGLIGHAREMAEGPVHHRALAGAGAHRAPGPGAGPGRHHPGGAYRNLEFAGPEVETAGTFPQAVLDCLYDPPDLRRPAPGHCGGAGRSCCAAWRTRGDRRRRRAGAPRGPRRIVLKP